MPASEGEFRDEYLDFTGGYGEHFDAYYEIFQETGISGDTDYELEGFFQFLNTFYPDTDTHDKEWWDNIRDSFYDMYGVTAEDIDWELWREAIGYGRS